MTAKIISLKKKEDEVHRVFLKRQNLMWKRPIMDEAITRLDMWLVKQPNLPLDCLVAIWSRAQFCYWISYGEAEPEMKYYMLLRLREHFEEFCQLPPHVQEKLWPLGWGYWYAQLRQENEEAGAANG